MPQDHPTETRPDASSELFQHYARHYANTGAERRQRPGATVRALHLDRLPRWIARVPHDARILDAGCANGYLLGLLHESGYTQLSGVELSEQLAASARAALPEDVSIHVADVAQFLATQADASFDVILFHHVLEHVPRDQTLDLLRAFRRCLAPGGLLDVRVPNAAFLLPGIHLHGDFTHVVHFNERSLWQVLERAGFDPAGIELVLHPPQLFFSLSQPMRMVLRLLNRLRWHLHRLVHRLLCMLVDQLPAPRAFEFELEMLARA